MTLQDYPSSPWQIASKKEEGKVGLQELNFSFLFAI